MATPLAAARALARMGWPIMPVQPNGKTPLTAHGVKDATTNWSQLGKWWKRWPDANVAIATGAPGPTVLDIDDPKAAGDVLPRLLELDTPQAATARGRHLYFAGQVRGTVTLAYGELRGKGSYVVCPPSIHESGKEYVWLREPNGTLPTVPEWVVPAERTTKGAGTYQPRKRVPHGERHDHLVDVGRRLVQARILDEATIERHLIAEYEAVCDKDPPAKPSEFADIARDAARSDIAKRERAKPAKPSRSTRTLPPTPQHDAPLAELRTLVAGGGGMPDVLSVAEVIRFGTSPADPMTIKLSNGMRVEFEAQSDVTTPRSWRNAWTIATSGICRPPHLKADELHDLLWALCVISTTTAEQRFEVELQSVVDDFTDLTESVRGTLEDAEARYHLLGALKERRPYDPSDGAAVVQPTLVVDMRTGKRYVRAAELMAFANHRKLGVSTGRFAARMRQIGLARHVVQGHGDSGHRGVVLYELPEEPAE